MKHARICAKTSNKTRKVFQSGKQRAEGSDVPITNVIKSGAPPPKVVSKAPKVKELTLAKYASQPAVNYYIMATFVLVVLRSSSACDGILKRSVGPTSKKFYDVSKNTQRLHFE